MNLLHIPTDRAVLGCVDEFDQDETESGRIENGPRTSRPWGSPKACAALKPGDTPAAPGRDHQVFDIASLTPKRRLPVKNCGAVVALPLPSEIALEHN